MVYCKICGEDNCKEHSFLLGKTAAIKEFSGSSPPEIFVGKWNYPNVYTGILSPDTPGEDTQILSSAELWHKNKLSIFEILNLRNKLIYGRKQNNIKQNLNNQKFISIFREIAMADKSVSAEFKLKKPITKNLEKETKVPLIKHAADVSQVRLQENPSINPKVDYLVNDTSAKSVTAMLELEKAGIETSSITKLLSAGLLGLKTNRKLVPTRWSITAVDDALSKEKLKKIKNSREISEFQLFNAEYLGNHYEFILLPDKFSFEVIENSLQSGGFWQDYESFSPRKRYAEDVTGAYYANRLALCEYLEKIKRQAQCIVLREVRPEYYAALGVGILRQISREAFSKQPEKFETIEEALQSSQKRLKQPISRFTERSIILKNYGKQKKLNQFF
ncbi:MAG TPA: hypothetical protein VI544_02175 [Candidatus Nanoarchaeia archaeon]|nr:hypothetical protein [Candidatus Nanoarchaeia archaeon]